MAHTTFDEVLDLEEQFYDAGYQHGFSDGLRTGRIEGRNFGLEKGFEKYVESGRLHGKSLIWGVRSSHHNEKKPTLNGDSKDFKNEQPSAECASDRPKALPQLPANARLAKHIKVLYALAESESLSTENTEEAVSDFDDRFKRAQAKAKIIERMVGEIKGDGESPGRRKDGGIEDALNARH